MPKRPSRENAKQRKASADFIDDDKKPIRTEIIISLDSDSDSTYVPTEEEIMTKLLEYIQEEPKQPPKKRQRKRKESIVEPALRLTRRELMYFNALPNEKKLELNSFMEKIKYEIKIQTRQINRYFEPRL